GGEAHCQQNSGDPHRRTLLKKQEVHCDTPGSRRWTVFRKDSRPRVVLRRALSKRSFSGDKPEGDPRSHLSERSGSELDANGRKRGTLTSDSATPLSCGIRRLGPEALRPHL